MPDITLSIIIPCYNCEQTLEEAVESVYRQGLSFPFEIVLVDDASTDDTRAAMAGLAQKHPEIRTFFHESNRGGGATRNTAAKKSRGDAIFCLDSDDMLGDGTLGAMYRLLAEKKCDGIGIGRSVKFNGRDLVNVAYENSFGYIGEPIPFISLFEKPEGPLCSLYSTFMFTRRAFEITGGYPEEHGFDTQGFAFRFLANGLTAYTCPEATYLHRVNFHPSYYIREYEAGKLNHNWFKVFEEFLYVFDRPAQEAIFSFDLNDQSENLRNRITARGTFLKPGYEELLKEHSADQYEQKMARLESRDPYDLYWLGAKKLREGKAESAIPLFGAALSQHLASPHLYHRFFQAVERAGNKPIEDMLRQARELTAYQNYGSRASLWTRGWRKLKKLAKWRAA